MGSLRNTRETVLLCLFLAVFLAGISPSVSSKVLLPLHNSNVCVCVNGFINCFI